MTQTEEIKAFLGKASAAEVFPGAIVGLGTGSTAAHFIQALGQREKQEALDLRCVATSKKSEALALSCGLKMIDLEKVQQVDIAVDGADYVDAKGLVIKGAGGALLKEKLIERLARRCLFIADKSKYQEGKSFPVELLPFTGSSTLAFLKQAGWEGELRFEKKTPWLSELGNWIVDLKTKKQAPNWPLIHQKIKGMMGVVETGIFCEFNYEVWIGNSPTHFEKLHYLKEA